MTHVRGILRQVDPPSLDVIVEFNVLPLVAALEKINSGWRKAEVESFQESKSLVITP